MHRMNGAFSGDRSAGEPADQTFPDFASHPAGVLVLHVQDVVLHVEGKLVGVAIGASAPVRQPFDPAFLVATEDLIAGLAGDAQLPAELGHRLPRPAAGEKTPTFISSPTPP